MTTADSPPRLWSVDDGETYFEFPEVNDEDPALRYGRMQQAVLHAPRLTPAEATAAQAGEVSQEQEHRDREAEYIREQIAADTRAIEWLMARGRRGQSA